MKEHYVTYEQAVKLKELGFDWKCDHLWQKEFTDSEKMALRQASDDDFNHDDWYVPHCSAPRLDQAQAWLRVIKGIDIELRVWLVGNKREYRPYVMPRKCKDYIAYPPEKSYELALSAGIDAALELLTNKN